jgi:hypothetical protein
MDSRGVFEFASQSQQRSRHRQVRKWQSLRGQDPRNADRTKDEGMKVSRVDAKLGQDAARLEQTFPTNGGQIRGHEQECPDEGRPQAFCN